MKCAICGLEIETIEQAINEDWLPSFHERDVEHGPVCSSCTVAMIDIGEDGAAELKPSYRGKIHYFEEEYPFKTSEEEEPLIEILVADKRGREH